MALSDEWMTEEFGPAFVPYDEEQELFEAHIESLRSSVDEDDLALIARFGQVGLSGFYID